MYQEKNSELNIYIYKYMYIIYNICILHIHMYITYTVSICKYIFLPYIYLLMCKKEVNRS